jgi:predicted aspartyl protease
MPRIEWRHNRKSLLLPIVVMAPLNAPNPNLSLRTTGLLDTGATGTGIRVDLAETLGLRPKGQRRVLTANGTVLASEYLMRIGFVCGDYTDPAFVADQQLPFVLEEPVLGFELQRGFGYALLIGMDILGAGDLSITRDGFARFIL